MKQEKQNKNWKIKRKHKYSHNCLTTKAFDLYKFNYILTNKGVERIRWTKQK